MYKLKRVICPITETDKVDNYREEYNKFVRSVFELFAPIRKLKPFAVIKDDMFKKLTIPRHITTAMAFRLLKMVWEIYYYPPKPNKTIDAMVYEFPVIYTFKDIRLIQMDGKIKHWISLPNDIIVPMIMSNNLYDQIHSGHYFIGNVYLIRNQLPEERLNEIRTQYKDYEPNKFIVGNTIYELLFQVKNNRK